MLVSCLTGFILLLHLPLPYDKQFFHAKYELRQIDLARRYAVLGTAMPVCLSFEIGRYCDLIMTVPGHNSESILS